ncbi:MAG: TonB-dependent receptor, partial [Acidobacteria bacterium]|nr:TonB-dependent receptor [Acidobacteriota bacterium]
LVGWSHAATENPQGGQQIFVNGQHFSGTGFELDGTDNQDPILGIIVVNPNLEAIQETKIALQNYDAEFGKAVAGLVTVQTKSGTNQLHGSGFWFRRTDALAATDPFTQYPGSNKLGPRIPHARWQQFGATLGGPIVKDKLFFFGDYQGTRQVVGITNPLSIPTARVLSTCTQPSSPALFCDLSEYLGNVNGGGQAYDPTTGDAKGNSRTRFVGNLIPTDRLSPQAVGILKAFPQPQNSSLTHNFIASGSGPFNQNSFDTREDYNISQTLQIFGRFSLDYFNLSGGASLPAVNGLPALNGIGFGPGGLAGSSTVHNISLAAGFTKTFSSTLLTDFRLGYFKYNPVTAKPDGGTPMNTFGIPGLNNSAQATSTAGLAAFFLGGQDLGNNAAPANGNQGQAITNFGDGLNIGRCNCPLIENEHQYQLVNNWTKIMGNHQMKFGGDLRFAHNLRVPSDANRTGQLNFSPEGTENASLRKNSGGLDLATFLLGDVTSFQRYVSTTLNAAESQKRLFFYGQDTWRVTPKFTLNYGLRWEIYTPESVNGKDKGGFANIVGTGTNGGGVIRVAGENGFGLNGNIQNNLTAFAPRLGIAYQLSPKTVVRMGYGRSFDIGVFGSNFGHTVTQNLPVLVNQQLAASNLFSSASDNIVPVFTLGCPPATGACVPYAGATSVLTTPTPYQFPTVFTNGELPLEGPANNVSPKVRPTKQVLPTLDAWNVTVQRQVTNSLSLEVAYIGNKGTHVFAGDSPSYNANPPSVVGYAQGVPQAQRRPLYNKFATPCADVTCVAPVVLCCSSDIGNYLGNDANSIYNALQIKAEKRFSHGLQFLSHYTFSHANKYDSNYYAISHAIAYGPDDQSRNHVWVNNIVYDLPFGRGKSYAGNSGRVADTLIGGWEISDTMNWSSGLPWTPSTNECSAEQDVGICRPSRGTGTFHVGAGHFDPINHDVPFFTPLTSLSGPFTDPGKGNLGNIGVFSFRGPRSFADDASVSKNFTLTERVRMQFRADFFNLFNHPVLGFNSNQSGSGQCIDCSGAGKITGIEADASPGSTTGMRQIEFALKLVF